MNNRTIQKRIHAATVTDGAGVNLRRSIGTPALRNLDPFLMLDHFSSDDPNDYIAGFPDHPHRGFGTFTRVLGHYVRDEGVLGLEDAVRKMTSAVADRLGLLDRGLLRPGLAADVVLFDPATVADRATFADPHRLSTGVRDLWVNGQRVLRAGEHTGALPGRRLHGPGRSG